MALNVSPQLPSAPLVGIGLYTVLCVLMPSGSFYGLNLKLIGALVSVMSCISFFLNNPRELNHFVTSAVGLVAFLGIYSLLAQYNGIPYFSTASQVTALVSTALLPMLVYSSSQGNAALSSAFLRVLVWSAAIHALIKCGVFLLIQAGAMSIQDYLSFNYEIFGYQPISLELGTSFVRINVPSDFIFPVALLALFQVPNLIPTGAVRKVGVAVILAATVITYSRYLWFYTSLILVSTLVRSRSGLPALVAIGLLTLAASVNLIDFFVGRYTGDFARMSDYDRTIISEVLSQMVRAKPFFGFGLGAFDPLHIRFPTAPWNYELQWLAYLSQVGLFGLLLTVFMLLKPIVQLTSLRISESQTVAFSYMLWLSVGLVNSFLITSSASVVFAGHLSLLLVLRARYPSHYVSKRD